MTDKPKNKNRKKSLVVLSIVKVLLILLTVSYSCGFYVKLENWEDYYFGKGNNWITVVGEDEDIMCKYSYQNGALYAREGEKEFEIPINQRTLWGTGGKITEYQYDYITIQLKKYGKTVGYAKIKVVCLDGYLIFGAELVEQKTCNVTLLELGIRKLFSN